MCAWGRVWWGVFSHSLCGELGGLSNVDFYVFSCREISLYYFLDSFPSRVSLCSLLLESSGLILLIFCTIFQERDLTSAFIFLISKFSFLSHWCSFLLLCHRCAVSSFENIHYVLKLFLALCFVSVSLGFFFLPPIYLSFLLEISSDIWRVSLSVYIESNALTSSMEALRAGMARTD